MLCAALALGAGGGVARAQKSGGADRRNAVVVHEGKTVPANGGVLVLVPTSHPGPDAKAAAATIEVRHGTDVVPGTLHELGWVEDLDALAMSTQVLIGAGLVWTADAPLTTGARYDVRVEVAGASTFAARFTAGEAWEPARPELVFDAELGSVDTGQDERHCCSTFLDGSGHAGCFVKRYAELPALIPEIGGDEADERIQQFLYLFRAYAPDTDATLWASGFRTFDSTDLPVQFLMAQEQYCVELEAKHIVSGEVFRWSHCAPAAELPESVIDPADGIAAALQLSRCSVPEYGDVLQWCELNREACARGDDPDCALYDALCGGTLREAFDVLHEMETIREGRADAGVAGHAHASADAGTRGDAGNGRGEGGGGCSAGGSPSRACDSAVLLAASGWLLARRRRSGVHTAARYGTAQGATPGNTP
jgi:hypothetical protein